MTTSQWCQRWSAGRLSWQLADPADRFDSRRYEVHPIDVATASDYVVRNHYSGSYVADIRRYGLFRAGRLVGAAIYSSPTNVKVLTNAFPDLEPYTESAELGRLVLADEEPGNTESWFVARCHEQLLAGGFRGVVSHADPVPRRVGGELVMPGHVGIIYQAGNATYCGRNTVRSLAVLPDGFVVNDRAKSKVRQQEQGHEYVERRLVAAGAHPMCAGQKPAVWLKQALIDARAGRVRHPGCHRYLFALGRNRRDRGRIRLGFAGGQYPKTVDREVS